MQRLRCPCSNFPHVHLVSLSLNGRSLVVLLNGDKQPREGMNGCRCGQWWSFVAVGYIVGIC